MFDTIYDYRKFLLNLTKRPDSEQKEICRHLCRTDLYFLLLYGLGRHDVERPWLLERCKEIQANPNGHLDLWAREHYKSTIITFAKTIQDILASHGDNPLPEWNGREITVGIFSCTRPIAKGFLRQIKREFEANIVLGNLFPDIIWENPHKEAPKWSEDDGLVVKRKSNPKESTIEAWGLVDGQPTSKHFLMRVYDDVVTIDNVRSPDMIAKTTEAWELSTNLGTDGGYERYVGTRYHFNDSYRTILARNAAIPRIYAATEDGKPDGEPVLIAREVLGKKRREMGNYTFACQMLLNPVGDETQGFKRDWLRWHKGSDGSGMNIYIIADPASEKKKNSDYTAIAVIGLSGDNNYYLLDGVRDRLNLTQRANEVFRLHRKWRPLMVGYEKYGMQADIEHLQYRMTRDNYHFSITELAGQMPKNDRIRRLLPIFEAGRFYLPMSLYKTLYDGRTIDIIEQFLSEEYDAFPVPVHDDFIDALARITDEDINPIFPMLSEGDSRDSYAYTSEEGASAWGA